MHTYAFDVKLFASIRLRAESETLARQQIKDIYKNNTHRHLDGPHGKEKFKVRYSLDDDPPDLIEVDGEAFEPPLTTG